MGHGGDGGAANAPTIQQCNVLVLVFLLVTRMEEMAERVVRLIITHRAQKLDREKVCLRYQAAMLKLQVRQ